MAEKKTVFREVDSWFKLVIAILAAIFIAELTPTLSIILFGGHKLHRSTARNFGKSIQLN